MFIERATGPRSLKPLLQAALHRLKSGYREQRSMARLGDARAEQFARELAEEHARITAVLDSLTSSVDSSAAKPGDSDSSTTECRSADGQPRDHLRAADGLAAESEQTAMPTLSGYAAVYNQEFDAKEFVETITPGAFDNSLKQRERIVSTFNHDNNLLLGTTPKTLALVSDSRGLWMRLSPPNSPIGQSVVESVRRGDVSGQSFSFTAVKDRWEMRDGKPHRTILDLRLLECGPVVWPAYPSTSISVSESGRSKTLSLSSRGLPTAPFKQAEFAKLAQFEDQLDRARLAELEDQLQRAQLRELERGLPAKRNAYITLDTARRRLRLIELQSRCV